MDREVVDRREQDRTDAQRRGDQRRRCMLGGYIRQPGSDRVETVSVRNLSRSGARVDLGGLRPISSGAVLVIPRLNAAFEVQVVWRQMPSVGLRFRRRHPVAADPELRALMRQAA